MTPDGIWFERERQARPDRAYARFAGGHMQNLREPMPGLRDMRALTRPERNRTGPNGPDSVTHANPKEVLTSIGDSWRI